MADVAEDFGNSLFAQEPPAEAEPAEPVVETEVAPQNPEPELEPEPEPSPERRPPDVPLATFLDLRERAANAERELQALRQAQAQRQPEPAPDLYDDPDAYRAHLQAEQNQQMLAMRVEMSRVMAEQLHGAETVEQAIQWARTQDPFFHERMKASTMPVANIVAEYKRDRLLNDIGSDPDAYVRRRYAELQGGSQVQAAPQPQGRAAHPQPAPSAAPPPSIANRTSAGPASVTEPAGIMEGIKLPLR